MEAIDVAAAIERLREKQTARMSTGRRSKPNYREVKYHIPIYSEPVVLERQRDLSNYGIKGRYIDMTFDKLQQLGIPSVDKEAYRNAYKYAMHMDRHLKSGRGLIMTGPVGTGKTSLAVSILQKAIDSGYNGYMISMVNLLDTLFALKDGAPEHRLKFERRITNTPLLVLDDFGAEYGNKWVEQKVNSLISARVADLKATIITTNLDPETLKGTYDARVYERLKESSFVLKFEGQSKREAPKITEI